MPKKDFLLPGGQPITVYKRRGNRNVRVTLDAIGRPRVSIPAWAPYRVGVDFALKRLEWIKKYQQPVGLLGHLQPVGKGHHLHFASGPKLRTQIRESIVMVTYPHELTVDSSEVQSKAEVACIKALKLQAEKLLPLRLEELAQAHGLKYSKVSVKKLKSRWGSCDYEKNIVLNLFLMQLPWELIDYVLIHELTHTEVLKHDTDFWQTMESRLPGSKQLRKNMRRHSPVLLKATLAMA